VNEREPSDEAGVRHKKRFVKYDLLKPLNAHYILVSAKYWNQTIGVLKNGANAKKRCPDSV
jgi:hypothetical protein